MSTNIGRAEVNSGGSDPRRWLALAIIFVAILLVVLDVSIVNIALPHVQSAICVSPTRTGSESYNRVCADLQRVAPARGRIAVFVGRKWIFPIGPIGLAAATMTSPMRSW